MISRLRGALLERSPDHVVLDVGGVGYRVFVSLHTLSSLGVEDSPVDLRIHTLVREDALRLFGFGSEQERVAFRKLVTVKGVGPKLAMTILGVPPEELVRAVRDEDVRFLSKIPGIGPKLAERLTRELRDSLGVAAGVVPAAGQGSASVQGAGAKLADLSDALRSLGYKPAQIAPVVKELREAVNPESSVEEMVKEALRIMR